ncbi:nitrate- and nitrite sensing domain-containing protein [Dactylosporangium sp. NPDC005572]|uniref:nitrate- and nitrite sensing domain-containing protein n=1 Tax=Dactylosporangium sp. NPDC005572 TaxID=3156889 RepID=UPI0033AFFD98
MVSWLAGWRRAALKRQVNLLVGCLLVFWGFGAWVTGAARLHLLGASMISTTMAKPGLPLEAALQAERMAAVRYLAAPSQQHREELLGAQRESERIAATWRQSAQGWLAGVAASGELQRRVGDLVQALDGLAETRTAISARQVQLLGRVCPAACGAIAYRHRPQRQLRRHVPGSLI